MNVYRHVHLTIVFQTLVAVFSFNLVAGRFIYKQYMIKFGSTFYRHSWLTDTFDSCQIMIFLSLSL